MGGVLHENDRINALKSYQVLDTLPEREFDRLTELASLICQTPISLISLLDENRQWFKARIGFDPPETDREIAFCQYTILEEGLMQVEDAIEDSRFKENPLVTADPSIRFYAGYPLRDPDGYAIGTLCVLDHTPRKLTPSQQEALRVLAETAIELIVENRQKQELLHLKHLFSLSDDLIFVAGTDGYFRKLNPAFQQVLGWDNAYLLSHSFYELVHPDDLPNTQAQLAQVALGKKTVNFVHRFRCQNGTYRHLQWVATQDPATGDLFAIARDMTVEKQQQQLLNHSEAKFRSFFEHSQGLLCIHDLDGKLLSVNTAGAQTLGYQPEELIGRRLSDIVPEKQWPGFDAYLQTIRAQGQATGLMNTLHKDGSQRIWLFNNILENDLDGQPYVIGNAIDITVRHQLEVELKRTQQMLAQTNEVARIGFWEVDVLNETLTWSSMTRTIHEVDADFVPTLTKAISFFRGPNQKSIQEALGRAIQEGTGYDLELQIVTATGRAVWVRTLCIPEFDRGVCKRLYGTFQDIDEKKKAEQDLLNEKMRLAAFVEHAPAAVAMFDRDIRYIAVSHRWKEEYKLSGNLIGLSHYDIFPGLSPTWKAIHARCVAGAVERSEEEIWRPPGWTHDQYLRWEVRPWYQFDGAIGGIMMYTQDITDVCLQRDELKKAKLLAEQASLAKSEFLANMSHEIRTPLNGVIGFTDLVLKTSLNTTQQQYLNIVNQSANALLNTINDILDFSKIEAGKLELVIEKVDIYELVSQAADIITYQAQSKGLEVLLNVGVTVPRFMYADSVRLKQVLVNLLGNAVKFTQKGEIELKISAADETQSLFRFEVRDTGMGIRPDMQQKIFQAFSQEDPSTTKKFGGTGLGLTISNKLLGLMGSQLELSSSPGEGSCFYFTVQLRTEAGDAIDWGDLSWIKRVLIVDDNDNNRLILRQMFLLKQIAVEEASNGFEALQLVAAQSFDVILMDYHMPYLDGLETIEKIRSNFSSSYNEPVILLLHSSSEDERIVKASATLGIHQRLVKPIKMDDLFYVLGHIGQADSREETVQTSVSTEFTGSSTEFTVQPIKVLIAEDNKVNQLLARTIVNRIVPNAEILEAVDGEEAVRLYREQTPDLILMDIQMPQMNGYEATRKIRELEQQGHVYIIALTAGTVKGEREKCLEAGMDDYITKPIVEETLRPFLRKCLEPQINFTLEPDTTFEKDAHFDRRTIQGIAGKNPEIARMLRDAAVEEVTSSLITLRQRVLDQDLTGIKALGHKLRGTALTAGMPTLAQLALTLEQRDTFVRDEINEIQASIESESRFVLALMAESPLFIG